MTLKTVRLGEIAKIFNGVSDTRHFEDSVLLTYSMIQPNHLGSFNDIKNVSVIKRQSPIDDAYLIREGDILFKRLNPDISTLVFEDLPNTTFSNNLFVVRIDKEFNPPYIASLLENTGIEWLNSNIVGSVSGIKSISTKALAELNIPVVSYEKQKAIGELWLLHKKRKQLLSALISEDERLIKAVINRITIEGED